MLRTARAPLVRLAATGLLAWSFAPAHVCEARCGHVGSGLSPAAPGPGPAGCAHGASAGDAQPDPGAASTASGGALACCRTAVADPAFVQARLPDARDPGALRLPAAGPPLRLAAATARRELAIPAGASVADAIRRQHRNPPLLI